MAEKLAAINAWRATQGLEPLSSSGKTAKARANGALRQAQANAAERAQANRDLKALRGSCKRK